MISALTICFLFSNIDITIYVQRESFQHTVDTKINNIFINSSLHIKNETSGDDQQACQFLKLKHHLHSSFEKSIIIERTMQYIEDRINNLMTIFLA